MPSRLSPPRRTIPPFWAFAFAFGACFLGLFFCMVKSPQAEAREHLAHAVAAYEAGHIDDAGRAAFRAVRLNPRAPQGWQVLSDVLQQKGDRTAAAQARNIAHKMLRHPDLPPPVYAMPAAFRLSLLASGDTALP